jgi:hypothetical protein
MQKVRSPYFKTKQNKTPIGIGREVQVKVETRLKFLETRLPQTEKNTKFSEMFIFASLKFTPKSFSVVGLYHLWLLVEF